jgi:hypothetical protein
MELAAEPSPVSSDHELRCGDGDDDERRRLALPRR